jgi:competence CoiA-like predicted nuclease
MLRIFFKNKKIYYFYIFLNKKQLILHLQTLLKKQPINFCPVMKKTLLIKRGEMDNRE